MQQQQQQHQNQANNPFIPLSRLKINSYKDTFNNRQILSEDTTEPRRPLFPQPPQPAQSNAHPASLVEDEAMMSDDANNVANDYDSDQYIEEEFDEDGEPLMMIEREYRYKKWLISRGKLKPETSSSSSSSSSDSEPDEDVYVMYRREYADVRKRLYSKPDKWRIMYERTGRLDVVFRGEREMRVNLDNVRAARLRFEDEARTRLNVRDLTNNLILTHMKKKSRMGGRLILKAKRTVNFDTSQVRRDVSFNTIMNRDMNGDEGDSEAEGRSLTRSGRFTINSEGRLVRRRPRLDGSFVGQVEKDSVEATATSGVSEPVSSNATVAEDEKKKKMDALKVRFALAREIAIKKRDAGKQTEPPTSN
jgi:hypothetical protein